MLKFQQPQMRIDQVTRQRQGPSKAKQQQSQRMSDYQSASGGKRKPCYRCFGTGYTPRTCRYKEFQCRGCQRSGHLERACHQRPPPAEGTPAYGGKQCFETAHCSQAVRGTRYTASTMNTQPQQATATREIDDTELLQLTAASSQQPPLSGEQRSSEKDFGLFSISRDDSEYVKPYNVTEK